MDALVFVQIGFILAALLFMPAYLTYTMWRDRGDSRPKWILQVLYTGAFVLWMFLAGPWDWVGYYFRYVVLTLYVLVLVVSLINVAGNAPVAEKRGFPWGELIPLVVFVAFLGWTITGFRYSHEPVQLAFPLREGWYYVAQGGSTTLLNYHTTRRPQRYAIDIVALNPFGSRANGLYPADPTRYAIFGHTVYSPCDGIVTHVVDGLPDLVPPERDPEHAAGNHVVVACHGVNVLLAHFKNGSIMVAPGAEVASGQPLGQVGNSGNTSEPHLHIHAERAGTDGSLVSEGVPIVFDDSFLVRNGTRRVSGGIGD